MEAESAGGDVNLTRVVLTLDLVPSLDYCTRLDRCIGRVNDAEWLGWKRGELICHDVHLDSGVDEWKVRFVRAPAWPDPLNAARVYGEEDFTRIAGG